MISLNSQAGSCLRVQLVQARKFWDDSLHFRQHLSMESTSRQSDILQKLQQIRRQLAKKERKLQKLKRLSAHKRSLESSESSTIAPEQARSSIGADVCSPLHPIETTLSQREICHSKLLWAVRPEDESLHARAPEYEVQAASSHGSVQFDRADGSNLSSPVPAVELTSASGGGGTLAPTALPSRTCRAPGASSAKESYCKRPRVLSSLSSAATRLAVGARSSVSEASTSDVLEKDTAALNVSECFSSALSSGISQGGQGYRGELLEATLKRGSKNDGGDVRLSQASFVEGGNCENKNEAAVHATLCDRQKDESKFYARNGGPLLTLSDEESSTHIVDHLESSQKEMLEDSEMCCASRDAHFSGSSSQGSKSWAQRSQLSVTQPTENTEPSCQTMEVSELVSPKSCSPTRKRRRTVCEQTVTADSANANNYNFRKRGLSCASVPQERRRIGKDTKTVLSAFHKLVKQALELPVTMFELHFEKLGLLQYLDVKGLSGCQFVSENPKSTANNSKLLYGCSDKTRASLSVEPDMSVGGNTLLEVQESQCSSSSEPAGIATLLLKSTNTERQLSTFFETRVTRRGHCQRQQRSLPTTAIPLANDAAHSSVALSAARHHRRSTRAAHRTQSVCALAEDHTGNAQTTALPSESSHVVHVPSETELLLSAQSQEVADADCASPACPVKGCSEVQALPLSPSGVCKVEDLCHQVQCGNFMSVHKASCKGALIVASSCSAFEGQKDITVQAPSQDISARLQSASRDPFSTLVIKTPKGRGEVKSGIDGTGGMPSDFPSASNNNHSGRSSQRSNRIHAEAVEDHVSELSSSQSSADGRSLENGEIDRWAGIIAGEEAAMRSPAHSMFTQSGNSDGIDGAMTDLVTNVVEQLGSQENSSVNCAAMDQHGNHVTILSDSATPDDLDILEVQACVLAPASGAPLPLPLCCGQENVPTETHGSEPERGAESATNYLGDSTDLLCSLRARCKAQGNTSADGADSASGPSSQPAAAGTGEAGPPGEDRWPSSADPASSPAAKEQAQKEPCTSSRCVAKRLFADSSGTDKGSAANSQVAELLNAQELEGMFDEWSEECALDTAARPATTADSRVMMVGSRGIFNRSHCNRSKEAAQGVFAEQQVAAVHLKSPQGSREEESGDECRSAWNNKGQMGPGSSKLECCPTHSLARSDPEDVRNLSPAGPCSPSPSASLEALSGISKFSDEMCGGRDMAHHAEQGECIGSWCDEDYGAAEGNCADAVDEQDACDVAACHRGSSLGTRNPLFFFCALKCEREQPVAATYLVRAEPHPFLVSVQASAVSVWHLEHNTWRLSMAAGKLKFLVEGGERCLLLCCGEWSVLAYLSNLVPMHVPCVQWRTADGGGKVQLMLTLGSLGDGLLRRNRSLYRMAKLGRGGWFATALRTAHGATLLRIHRLRYVRGELGDETEPLGCTSNLLDSLVGVEGHPDALLGNSANIFYVWDCESRLLVKKMIHEPDMFADLRHISWCCSDKGLLFVLMRSSDDVTSTLVAMNPFSCKAEAVCSSSWKMAAQARACDSRPCGVHVEGRYAACVGPGYGVRIWNLFTGNAVADMRYHSSTSVTMTDISGTTFVAVGSADGRVLVFTS